MLDSFFEKERAEVVYYNLLRQLSSKIELSGAVQNVNMEIVKENFENFYKDITTDESVDEEVGKVLTIIINTCFSY